jgi:16S rRNA (cytidine1402-2'-O)-methyltransferase
MVFFEAPHRTADTLQVMAEVFGRERRAAACRELTKTYEEVRRGTLDAMVSWAAEGVRGEVTLVIAGSPAPAEDLEAAVAEVRGRQAEGMRLKPAVAEVASSLGLAKNALYSAVLADRGPAGQTPTGPLR